MSRRVLVVAILGSSMAFLDGSVVNVVLPVMQRDLAMTAGAATWVVEAYALLLSSLVLVGGALGDRYGRRRVFCAGAVLFAVASAACGGAPSAPLLVAARAAQGVGAALLVPGSLSLITAAYSDAERGRAIGIWSTFSAVTGAVGPVAGGFVAAHASWRWVFFFNVPMALATVLLARSVPETRDDEAAPRMDWLGASLVTCALAAVVYPLIDDGAGTGKGGQGALLAAGVALFLAFLQVERRSPAPMVPLFLFRSSTFAGTNVLTLLLYGALGGGLFFLPFNLIQVQGYTPQAAGAALLPLILAISVLSPTMGAAAARVGARTLLVGGPLVSACAFLLLALPGRGGSYWATYFPGILVLGLGMGITVAPLTAAVMGSVESHRAGVASGVNNAVARAGGLLAVAALGLLLRARFDHVLDESLAASNLPQSLVARALAERVKLGAADFGDLDPSTRGALRSAFDSAYVAGFRALMIASAALAAGGALAASVSLGRSAR